MLPTPIKLSVCILVSITFHYAMIIIIDIKSSLGVLIVVTGSPTAGESYTLKCLAGGSEGTFQWLGPPDGRTPVLENNPRRRISSNTTSSQLQFRPLQQSDNGSYSCSATVDGSVLLSEAVAVAVNGTAIKINIT